MEQVTDIDAPQVVPIKKKNGVAKVETVAVSETAAVMQMISRMATDPTLSPERCTQAFDFYQRVKADDARRAFDAAMADAKAEIPPIFKNKVVDFTSQKGRTHYRHEDLSEIARTVDPILSKHGLSYRFRTKSDAAMVEVTCVVSHRDGHFEETALPGPHDHTGNKNAIQAIGSAVTFLQRYTLKIALGLAASADDDAKSAGADKDRFISAAEAEEITNLIDQTKSDWAKFQHAFEVETVSDLTVEKFTRAKAMLKKKAAGGK